jgi:hypothetical protein
MYCDIATAERPLEIDFPCPSGVQAQLEGDLFSFCGEQCLRLGGKSEVCMCLLVQLF